MGTRPPDDDSTEGVTIIALLDWFSSHDELAGYTLDEILEDQWNRLSGYGLRQ